MHCATCQAAIDTTAPNYFELFDAETAARDFLCSPTCLVERAWAIRQASPRAVAQRRRAS